MLLSSPGCQIPQAEKAEDSNCCLIVKSVELRIGVADSVGIIFGVQGATPMGEVEWEMARILQGRPAAGKELTEQHIPLEAGLYHAVSLNKGCYMGQETLAKVHKLDAVKQQLKGLLLDGAVQPGTPLLSGHSLLPSYFPFRQHYIFHIMSCLLIVDCLRPSTLAGTCSSAACDV